MVSHLLACVCVCFSSSFPFCCSMFIGCSLSKLAWLSRSCALRTRLHTPASPPFVLPMLPHTSVSIWHSPISTDHLTLSCPSICSIFFLKTPLPSPDKSLNSFSNTNSRFLCFVEDQGKFITKNLYEA